MIEIENVKVVGGFPFILIAGPYVVENEEIILKTAEQIKNFTEKLSILLIFRGKV